MQRVGEAGSVQRRSVGSVRHTLHCTFGLGPSSALHALLSIRAVGQELILDLACWRKQKSQWLVMKSHP